MIETVVKIREQLMGTGKSWRAIEEINNAPKEERFIVVAPFLDECHRYAGTSPDPGTGDKKIPIMDGNGVPVYNGTGCNASGREFVHPISGYRNKVQDLERLVKLGKDIVTTHAALKMFTPETRKAIQDNGYTLIIDEELEAVEQLRLRKERMMILLNSGIVHTDEKGLLRWDDKWSGDEGSGDDIDSSGLSWEQRIKRLCDNGSLMLTQSGENGERMLLMWEYPIDFLTAFDKVEVMTYLFEGSVFQKYLMVYGIKYEVEQGVMLPDNPFELINIVENPRMNRVGDRMEAFSATHQKGFQKGHAVVDTVRDNLVNFFNNSTYGKSKGDERLWTSLKSSSSLLKGKGYSRRFVPHNIKAVNSYIGVSKVAYVYNPYILPEVYKHLLSKGEEFAPSMDRHLLSEVLQMVYRSRVRVGEPISLYIPSRRVRETVQDWQDGKYT